MQLCVNPAGSEFGICRGFEGDAGKPDVGCGPEEVRTLFINNQLKMKKTRKRKKYRHQGIFFFFFLFTNFVVFSALVLRE